MKLSGNRRYRDGASISGSIFLSGHASQVSLAIHVDLHSEGSLQANHNNEHAPDEQHDIADAKQSQPRLVC
jgi:hypothetical protein